MRLSPLLAATLLATLPARAADGPSTATLAKIAPAIVRVVASHCSGDETSRAGSGFAWPSAGQIVTDLHVVVGCQTIAVDYQGIDERPARVAHVLVPADLVLLAVDGAPPTPSLAVAPSPPPPGTEVDVFGYALGQPTRDTHPLELTFGNAEAPHLADVLPDAERQDITRAGFPALSTDILRLDGNLLPGNSGAPIIDPSGTVIGIGSGGLERGAVGVGWAVRAHYLPDLLHAPPDMPDTSQGATSAFATAAPQTRDSGVRCGAFTLYRRRILPLAKLVSTASQPDYLQELATGITGVRLDSKSMHNDFAIWSEPRSGATLVLPAWLKLEPGDDACRMHSRDDDIRTIIAVAPLPPGPDRRSRIGAALKEGQKLLERMSGVPMRVDHAYTIFEHRQGNGVRHNLANHRIDARHVLRAYRTDFVGRDNFMFASVIGEQTLDPSGKPIPSIPWALGVYGVALSGLPPAAPSNP